MDSCKAVKGREPPVPQSGNQAAAAGADRIRRPADPDGRRFRSRVRRQKVWATGRHDGQESLALVG